MVSGKLRRGSRNNFRHETPTQVHINGIFRVPAKDTYSKRTIQFLIDSGAAVSVLPYKYFKPDHYITDSKKLVSANQTPINSYGHKTLIFTLPNFVKEYKWSFMVSDVSEPILGADFLSFNDLMVDCKRCSVHLRDFSVEIQGNVEKNISVSAIVPPEVDDRLTQPPLSSPILCETKHYIDTGSVRSIAQRCRRIAGPRLHHHHHIKPLSIHLLDEGLSIPFP